ncbi:MAG: hypothetical protein V1793_19205 [Pseudomonadota bacterium]
MNRILLDEAQLTAHIMTRLQTVTADPDIFFAPHGDNGQGSVVLFLLGVQKIRSRNVPCLILNKRSRSVIQPGDLCCPGGGISPATDAALARLLRLPGSPLAAWPGWRLLKSNSPKQAVQLSMLYATALREGFEEMKLNPFCVRFLGRLPSQSLVLFKRIIHPMACWVSGQDRFYPNWEVERIVSIPLESLLVASNYGLYRVRMELPGKAGKQVVWIDFPCFMHREATGKKEMLWGATFRIVMDFLSLVFDAAPPPDAGLPVFYGSLGQRYMAKTQRH